MSNKLLDMIKEEAADYVDVRFTDPRGKLQHVTLCADQVDEDFIEDAMKESGKSPSPRYTEKDMNQKMNLSTSECMLKIRNLRDDYQNLTRKVIELREDGS